MSEPYECYGNNGMGAPFAKNILRELTKRGEGFLFTKHGITASRICGYAPATINTAITILVSNGYVDRSHKVDSDKVYLKTYHQPQVWSYKLSDKAFGKEEKVTVVEEVDLCNTSTEEVMQVNVCQPQAIQKAEDQLSSMNLVELSEAASRFSYLSDFCRNLIDSKHQEVLDLTNRINQLKGI